MQQPATESDISLRLDHVTEHVARIPLPLPLIDLRVVNAYAIHGDDGVTLVDPGWADERSEAVLVQALDQLGFAPEDVGQILVTHAHWDHYSRAIAWQRKYGTPVFLGREERHSVTAFEESEGAYPVQAQYLMRAGAPDLAVTIANLPLEPYERNVPLGRPDGWLEDGDVVDAGGRVIHAWTTPGHTRGHVVFEDPADGLLFSGDHVLPRITPSIALERSPELLPLRSYLGSLHMFDDRSDLRLLPAHGPVTDSAKQRVDELLDHHRERLEHVYGLVANGASTAYHVARQMTWTRHLRTVDQLGPVHGMVAILEVAAHLDLLVYEGRLTSQASDDGVAHHFA